jgi:hypothetical protein
MPGASSVGTITSVFEGTIVISGMKVAAGGVQAESRVIRHKIQNIRFIFSPEPD